eukprot:m.696968 g.696968  ORF g.696968 m.696968 type:complete len:84 (+) comp58675_c0_seq3:804-1055(+)
MRCTASTLAACPSEPALLPSAALSCSQVVSYELCIFLRSRASPFGRAVLAVNTNPHTPPTSLHATPALGAEASERVLRTGQRN